MQKVPRLNWLNSTSNIRSDTEDNVRGRWDTARGGKGTGTLFNRRERNGGAKELIATGLGLEINPRWLTGCPDSRNQFSGDPLQRESDRNQPEETCLLKSAESRWRRGLFPDSSSRQRSITRVYTGCAAIAGAVYETWFILTASILFTRFASANNARSDRPFFLPRAH